MLASFSSRSDVVPTIHCVTPSPAGTALRVREGKVKLKVMASAAMAVLPDQLPRFVLMHLSQVM